MFTQVNKKKRNFIREIYYKFQTNEFNLKFIIFQFSFIILTAHNDLHNGLYPMVPGHELVGVVVEIGSKVTQFKLGDNAGVGCLVDSCLNCPNCLNGDEQYCQNFITLTYSGFKNKDGHLGGNMNTQTHGGYTKSFVA
jgi:uncharacterized zinc-type alcohol dehydrogenase-like protein